MGPVANLEEHIRPEWWRSLFNQYYLKTDGDLVNDPEITSHEVSVFSAILRVTPSDCWLDVCCGQGRHCVEIARRKLALMEGVDTSEYLLRRARRSAREQGLAIRFKNADARDLPYDGNSFDALSILGNSFGYFEDASDDLRVLREAARVLRPGGRILIDVADGEYLRSSFQKRSWEWMDGDHFVCRERSLTSDSARLVTREVITAVRKGVIADQVFAERLYTRQTLGALLAKAGFSDAFFHENHAPESARNQDLGMMEQRILVSANVKAASNHRARARGSVAG